MTWLPSQDDNWSAQAARGRSSAGARRLTVLACALLAVALCAYTAAALWPAVRFRADILMWAESDVVGNVIKLSSGAPLYGAPEDSNSQIYTPGASLLTFHVARAFGVTHDIAGLRTIQLLFATLAAFVALYVTRLLTRLADPDRFHRGGWPWQVLCLALLWLACTSPRVNAYVPRLHADAAALLVSVGIFALAARWVERPTTSRWILLALAPGIGYFVKQLLVSWVGALTLLVAAREPSRVRRWVGFALLSGFGVLATVGLCYLAWGDAFLFWTFGVMGGPRQRIGLVGEHGISLLRAADHLLRAWTELAPGLVGGIVLLRGPRRRALAPLWVAWVALVAAEAVSSGVGWNVLYHFGPGAVLGLCWLLAALPRIGSAAWWPPAPELPRWARSAWQSALLALAVLATVLALRVLPSRDPHADRYFPPDPLSPDLERYVAEIEREVAVLPFDDVLLDCGNWVYLDAHYLARDRVVPLADQPLAGIYRNFDPLLGRIRDHHYAKILVRDLRSTRFLYDWHIWPRSSGVRQALLDNYREVRVISAAEMGDRPPAQQLFTGPVSVLVPKETP